MKAEAALAKGLTTLGMTISDQNTIESSRKRANEERLKLDEEINKRLSIAIAMKKNKRQLQNWAHDQKLQDLKD
jgi:hypothetical protein